MEHQTHQLILRNQAKLGLFLGQIALTLIVVLLCQLYEKKTPSIAKTILAIYLVASFFFTFINTLSYYVETYGNKT